MAQQSIGVKRVVMDARRAVALSGVMAALMEGLAKGLRLSLHTGEGLVEDGGGDFRCVRTRRYLWSSPGSQQQAWPGHKAPFFCFIICVSCAVIIVWWLRLV